MRRGLEYAVLLTACLLSACGESEAVQRVASSPRVTASPVVASLPSPTPTFDLVANCRDYFIKPMRPIVLGPTVLVGFDTNLPVGVIWDGLLTWPSPDGPDDLLISGEVRKSGDPASSGHVLAAQATIRPSAPNGHYSVFLNITPAGAGTDLLRECGSQLQGFKGHPQAHAFGDGHFEFATRYEFDAPVR